MEDSLARMGIVGNLYKVYLAAIELGDVPVSTVIEHYSLRSETAPDHPGLQNQPSSAQSWNH